MATNSFNSTTKNGIIRNLESFTCVWLDETINETDDSRETEQRLQKVVLIISGALGKDLILRIHHLTQLSVCYIFCARKEFHKQWADLYSKVQGVFDDLNELIEKLFKDQHNRAKFEEIASISVISHNSQSLEERNIVHMWFQLYIEVLLRMHHKLSDQKELVDLCKNACKDNDAQLTILNEFEKTYKCEQAIWWYTRESCLYRILNKALRFQDIGGGAIRLE